MVDYTRGTHATLGDRYERQGLGASNRGRYIRLTSGRKFYLNDPKPEDVFLEDVARNLSGMIRYTGASRYSVAQHQVIAAWMADKFYPDAGPVLGRRMLIHDTAEAYYGDVSSPLKSLLPDYKKLEDRADACMEQRFGLTFNGEPFVKEIDDRMWVTESRQFFGPIAYEDYPEDGPLKSFDVRIYPWTAVHAEGMWLAEMRKRFPEIQ